jgi:hypothetical protein
MATVVIGGQARKVGKTSVVAGLIAALPDFRWTAVKVSGHEHGQGWGITEEQDRTGNRDTSKFLAAGAPRALWVRAEASHLGEASVELKRALGPSNVIIESNSIVKFLRPDVYLVVLDPPVEDFKDSARELLPAADAFILHECSGVELRFDKPVFRIAAPPYITSEIVEFVRGRVLPRVNRGE